MPLRNLRVPVAATEIPVVESVTTLPKATLDGAADSVIDVATLFTVKLCELMLKTALKFASPE